MNRSSTLAKALTLTSSLLLAFGYIWNQATVHEWIGTCLMSSPNSIVLAPSTVKPNPFMSSSKSIFTTVGPKIGADKSSNAAPPPPISSDTDAEKLPRTTQTGGKK